MKTPVSFYVIAAAFLSYAVLTAWGVFKYSSLLFLIWSVPCVVTAVGLMLKKAWVQYFVYVICSCLLAGWATYFAMTWQSLSQEGFIRMAMLGSFIFAFGAWSSFVTWRFFRKKQYPL